MEADHDSARPRPLVVAPNWIADLTSLDLPIRVGVALPVGLLDSDTTASWGVLLRLFWVSEREARYGSRR